MPSVRYNLRHLLLLGLIVSVAFAIYTERSLRQWQATRRILADNGIAIYSAQTDSALTDQILVTNQDFWWHFLNSVDCVILQPTADCPADTQLRHAAMLPCLKILDVWPGGVNDDWQPQKRDAEGGMTDAGVDILISELGGLDHFATASANCSQSKLQKLDVAMAKAQTLIVLPPKVPALKGQPLESRPFLNRQ